MVFYLFYLVYFIDEKFTLKGHEDAVFALLVLPNGDLVSASDDKTIKIWDLNKKIEKTTLTSHKDGVRALALLKNGDLASASYDSTIKIWNLNDGSVKKTIDLEV